MNRGSKGVLKRNIGEDGRWNIRMDRKGRKREGEGEESTDKSGETYRDCVKY